MVMCSLRCCPSARREVTEERARNGLLDVSDQVATLVDGRIAQSIESLTLIRDSAVPLSPDALPEFVARKASVSGFDQLYLAENVKAAEEWIRAHSGSLAGGDMVEPCKAQLIMSHSPEIGIYYAAGETADETVMLDTKNADLLCSMLSIQSFNSEGSTRLVTRDGVLRPGRPLVRIQSGAPSKVSQQSAPSHWETN